MARQSHLPSWWRPAPRITALLPQLRRTGILFTQTVLGEKGDAAVIGYDDRVDRLLSFTSDADAIEKTISNLKEGTSGARLYDALSAAVDMLRQRSSSRRRVIVTMAEAVDTGSEEKLGQILREAQLANITIYSIGLSSTAAALRGPQTHHPADFRDTPRHIWPAAHTRAAANANERTTAARQYRSVRPGGVGGAARRCGDQG